MVLAILALLGVTAYTSYGVYRIVRTTVAGIDNLPSIEILKETAGVLGAEPAQGSGEAPQTGGESAPQPTTESGGAPAGQVEEPTSQQRINILLLGIDQRPGEQGPFRTDTMIVLTVDPATGTAGMLSIPRDLWVPIPGYGENRINTANFLGDMYKHPGGGPALAKKTVAYNLGFPIHYYVRVNFEGFKRIVDMVGGIDIEVPHEIKDDSFPDDNYGYDPLYIPAGLVHMDGELALKYARTRHGDDDFQRARRQQQVILALKDKVLDLNLLPSLIPKLPELMATLSDSVQTDMPMDEILRLARLSRELDFDNVKTVVIDETMTIPQTTPSGARVLLPIRENIRPVVDDLFWSPLPTIPPPTGN